MSVDDDPHQVPLSRFRLHPRESFRYEYDFTANWRVDIRREEILPQDQRVVPVCTGGRAAAPGEEYAGALIRVFATAGASPPRVSVRRIGQNGRGDGDWLDAGGGRQALGDLDELRQAAERVRAYQEFQPRRCDRRAINGKLRAMGQEAVA